MSWMQLKGFAVYRRICSWDTSWSCGTICNWREARWSFTFSSGCRWRWWWVRHRYGTLYPRMSSWSRYHLYRIQQWELCSHDWTGISNDSDRSGDQDNSRWQYNCTYRSNCACDTSRMQVLSKSTFQKICWTQRDYKRSNTTQRLCAYWCGARLSEL